MSDRRERINRAIDELVVACLETADTPDDEPGAVARILAEQRLRAVMDAEPTEAEVDVAADAYLDSMPEHIALDCAFVYPGAIRAALTAFLAARTARP